VRQGLKAAMIGYPLVDRTWLAGHMGHPDDNVLPFLPLLLVECYACVISF
jgi:hypothetical protein